MTKARTLPLVATVVIALVAAVSAFGFSGGRHTHAHKAVAISQKELKLHSDMRKLWEDHVTWTRLAIISLTSGSPDTQATVGRLLRNQVDIGNAVKPFYGKAAGNHLTALLRAHILIAADLIAAAKAGDQQKLAAEQARWNANADQIATFLSRANPKAWKLAPMKAMMRAHLGLTTQEAVARLKGDWATDVAAYDAIHQQALHMADMLSNGIAKQFARRFR